MTIWDDYPQQYRQKEITWLLRAVLGGDCVSIVGLSGAGKSNLAGFAANRLAPPPGFVLVDCNRLVQKDAPAFFHLIGLAVQGNGSSADPVPLEILFQRQINAAPQQKLCLLLDRFDALDSSLRSAVDGSLRSLRDRFKYQLTYVTTSRRPVENGGELDELFYASTAWLGPLSPPDAAWSARKYAARFGIAWKDEDLDFLLQSTRGYPAFLRAACEALAAGCPPSLPALLQSPPLRRRLAEFFSGHPGDEELRLSGLENLPLLAGYMQKGSPEAQSLTAKEALLLAHFQAHPGAVCSKDELIRAAWPEDKIYEDGIRDDALAQLIRRLRRKTEEDPSNPSHIQTLPGRGYLYREKR
jgi:hypothetical protein